MSVVQCVDIEVMRHNEKNGLFINPKLQWRNLYDREFLLRYDNDIPRMAYMLFNEPKRMHCFGENRKVLINMYDPFRTEGRLRV